MGKATHPLTIGQKLALRDWYAQQETKPSQAACAAWLKSKFNASVSQPFISNVLRSKALEALDSSEDPGMQSYRISHAEWPLLERILRNWQVDMEARGFSTSRMALQDKARWIWLNVPEARKNIQDFEDPPLFGRKWYASYLKRWAITPLPSLAGPSDQNPPTAVMAPEEPIAIEEPMEGPMAVEAQFQLASNNIHEGGQVFCDEPGVTSMEETRPPQTIKPAEGIQHIKELIDLGNVTSVFDAGDILVLNRLMRTLEGHITNSRIQGTVDMYFKPIHRRP